LQPVKVGDDLIEVWFCVII